MNDIIPTRIPPVRGAEIEATALSGPGIYRTADDRKVTWSPGNHSYDFRGERRIVLAVENFMRNGQFSMTYRMDGTPLPGFSRDLCIIAKESCA